MVAREERRGESSKLEIDLRCERAARTAEMARRADQAIPDMSRQATNRKATAICNG